MILASHARSNPGLTSNPWPTLETDWSPAAEAKLSIYDLGIVMGATVTDMVRTYRHEPFRLKDHLVRFYESCKYARLEASLSLEATEKVTRELTIHNAQELAATEDLAIVYFITPGENPVYAGSAAGAMHLASESRLRGASRSGSTFCNRIAPASAKWSLLEPASRCCEPAI